MLVLADVECRALVVVENPLLQEDTVVVSGGVRNVSWFGWRLCALRAFAGGGRLGTDLEMCWCNAGLREGLFHDVKILHGG